MAVLLIKPQFEAGRKEAARGKGSKILLRAGREAAIFLLNKKRAELYASLLDYLALVEGVVDALRPDSPEPGTTVIRESSGAVRFPLA